MRLCTEWYHPDGLRDGSGELQSVSGRQAGGREGAEPGRSAGSHEDRFPDLLLDDPHAPRAKVGPHSLLPLVAIDALLLTFGALQERAEVGCAVGRKEVPAFAAKELRADRVGAVWGAER